MYSPGSPAPPQIKAFSKQHSQQLKDQDCVIDEHHQWLIRMDLVFQLGLYHE